MEQPRDTQAQHDVIIVGGRPAGASLAARLGARGRRVLVVDRAEFPSAPAVPSCPVIYPAAMELLDEIGVAESDYAAGAIKIRSFVIEFHTYFEANMKVCASRGREYVYGIDRAPFDHAIWESLARFPTVTARAGFTFDELIRDAAGAVIGIQGHAEGGAEERHLAPCVVGADGRFSAVARKAGARVTEDRPEHVSTVFFGDWEGVRPFGDDSAPQVHIHATGRGTDVLHIPLPSGRTTICTHQRADRVDVRGDAEAYYHGVLDSYASVRRRTQGAKRVTPVLGMKRVGNRYLEAGGPGWVLVGDALHHKDPVDGQGIYDALLEAKRLDEALASVDAGTRTFAEAVAWYDKRVQEDTHGMFVATMERLKNELYAEPPPLVARTLVRWLLLDPAYQERFVRFLYRDIAPEGWLSPALVSGAVVRGVLGDLRGLFGRPRPAA
jgi:2-polyprenyl-6-methoxyphenol hydroxylase-like FAD-dependent oxidoreductase